MTIEQKYVIIFNSHIHAIKRIQEKQKTKQAIQAKIKPFGK